MFELKVTIGINPETMGLISKLLGSPQTIAFKDVTEPEAPKVEKPRGVKVSKPESVVNGHSEKQPEINTTLASIGKTETSTTVLTIEEVRSKIAAKKQELNDAEPIKKLLQSFGVSKATDLPSDAYLPFITQLETLKSA